MNDYTFICLLYIYILMVSDKYSKRVIKDFKKDCIFVFKSSTNISHFRFSLINNSLSLPLKEYKIRRNFVKFISDNNRLLGYDY